MTIAEDAIARLLHQFEGTDLEDLASVIFGPLDELQTALEQLRDNLNIEDAEGYWLSLLGALAGYPRPPKQHPYAQMFALKAPYGLDDPNKALLGGTWAEGYDLVTNGTFDTDLSSWDDSSVGDGSATWDAGTESVELTGGSGTFPELVTNGTFTGSLTGWTTSVTGTLTITEASNQARFDGGGSGGTGRLRQTVTTVNGYSYEIQIDTVANSGSAPITLKVGTALAGSQLLSETITSVDNYSFEFTAGSTTSYVEIYSSSQGPEAIVTFDNVSVRQTSPASAGCIEQIIATDIGTIYNLHFESLEGSATGSTGGYVAVGTEQGLTDVLLIPLDVTGEFDDSFTATTESCWIRLYCEWPENSVFLDNVSLKPYTFTSNGLGGYLQSPQGLGHMTDPGIMDDDTYRIRVAAKMAANGMSGTVHDFYSFLYYIAGVNHIEDKSGYVSAIIELYSILSQNDRYNIALRSPHSACIRTGIENWTFEYIPIQRRVTEDIVYNGDFRWDDDWAKPTGWTISGGTANKAAGTAGTIWQTGGMCIGKNYVTKFTLSNVTAGSARVYCGGAGAGTSRTADGEYEQTIANSGSDLLGIYASSTFVGSVDDVSMRLESNSWTIENDTVDGDESKCLLCGDSDDFLTIKRVPYWWADQRAITATEFAYGEWTCWLYHQDGTHQEWMFVASQAGPADTSGNDGYEIYITSSEYLNLYRVDNAVRAQIGQTDIPRVLVGWNEIRVTRGTTGLITVYINGTSRIAVTDTTYTTSNYHNWKLEQGDKVALCTLEDQKLYDYTEL